MVFTFDSKNIRMCVFSALYAEAKPLIARYSMKQQKSPLPFPIWLDREGKILLVLSGTGPVAMASAVSGILAGFAGGRIPRLINWGSCGCEEGNGDFSAEPGTVYCCNRITDQKGRSWYPDMLVRTGLLEAELISEDKRYCRNEGSDEILSANAVRLHDMEGAAFCQSAWYYTGPDHLHLFKVVTDKGCADIDRTVFGQIMEAGAETVFPVLEKLKEAEGEKKATGAGGEERLRRWTAELDCSETMKNQLRELLNYADLSGFPAESWYEEKRRQKKVPCDRRQGKLLLASLRRRLDGTGECEECAGDRGQLRDR